MNRVSNLAIACVCTRVLAAGGGPALAEARDERFGVMTHFAQGWDSSLATLVARAGIGTVRDELYWREIEPKKGKFVFPAPYERYMGALKRAGISPFIVLSFENPNYDLGDTPHTPEGFEGYARYAVNVLRHYGSQIKAVEIWNEYNGTFNHGPASQDRAGTYLQMLRVVYPAIKRERPDVTVVGGATIGVPLPYWEKLLAGGGLAFMDAVSVHPYRYRLPPEGLESDIASLRTVLGTYDGGKAKPIWVTEIGWETRKSEAPGDLAIDDEVQARFLVRAYALLLSADVQRVYWYQFRDHQGMAMGLVHDDNAVTRRPAYDAYATMVAQLRGAHFVRREQTPGELYSLLFARPNHEEVRVIWSLKAERIPVSGASCAVNLIGLPVAMSGALEVDDSPVYVTGPLTGLPAACTPSDSELTDSTRDFSLEQGKAGWSYGTINGENPALVPLPNNGSDDWHQIWTGAYPFAAITATDQHPSVVDGKPVAVVRRWRSNYDGEVRIAGSFRVGTTGDGVGVKVAVDGEPRCEKRLGGEKGSPVVEEFDFVASVHDGTTLDFAVDPGPAANINGDATSVAVIIRKETP